MDDIYHGDVLETALNAGIRASAERYGLSEQAVYDIVRKFKDEVDIPCFCEDARSRGVVAMCFICDKQSRINI